jgi:hypothetical protein
LSTYDRPAVRAIPIDVPTGNAKLRHLVGRGSSYWGEALLVSGFNSPRAFRRALFALVSNNLFEFESLDDVLRKAPLSVQYSVDMSTVDPRPPRPGSLTASPIHVFA